MRRRHFIGIAGLGLVLTAGCAVKSPPDPNNPSAVGNLQPEVLQRNLRWASDMVNDRVAREEITTEEGKKLLSRYAGELVEQVDFRQMSDAQAWKYADVFRTAERWELAEKALERAVAHASKVHNQDRLVNDTLRLAQAQANLGKYVEAMKTARSIFSVPDKDKAPILLSVLYEIAPAIRGHGHDAELASLIEDAIAEHMKVVVDAEKEEGQAFLAAKSHHLRKAWTAVLDLYRAAGQEEKADIARAKMDAMLSDLSRL